jgi:hypothetical protein
VVRGHDAGGESVVLSDGSPLQHHLATIGWEQFAGNKTVIKQ